MKREGHLSTAFEPQILEKSKVIHQQVQIAVPPSHVRYVCCAVMKIMSHSCVGSTISGTLGRVFYHPEMLSGDFHTTGGINKLQPTTY